MFDLAAAGLAFAVGAIAGHLFRTHRSDAEVLRLYEDLRSEREQLAERDAQLSHAAQQLAQAESREALAAANIIQLSGALLDATAKVQAPAAGIPPTARIWLN